LYRCARHKRHQLAAWTPIRVQRRPAPTLGVDDELKKNVKRHRGKHLVMVTIRAAHGP
jgi:hypothetical protein